MDPFESESRRSSSVGLYRGSGQPYPTVLDIDPKNPDANHNLSPQCEGTRLPKIAIKIKSGYAEANSNVGIVYQ